MSMTEIAEAILANAKALDALTASKNLPSSSFDTYTLANLPKDAEDLRKALVDSTQELRQLAVGPIGQIFEILFSVGSNTPGEFTDVLALHFIYRNQLASYVPDEGDISFADIAKSSGVDEVLLRRFIQHAIHSHIFKESTPGHVSHTAASLLIKEEQGMRDSIGFLTEDIGPASTKMIEAQRKWPGSEEPNETGFNVEFNTSDPFYVELAKDPERSRRFGAGMVFMTRGDVYDIRHLINGFDWAGLDEVGGTVVDVGGGHGAVSQAIASATSRLQFIVQDLPGTVKAGVSMLPAELKGRVTFMAHDFLTEQPVQGADVYFFRFILHNWSDKYAVRILRNLIPSMKHGSKVVIYEFLPSEVATTSWSQKQSRNLDMIQATGWNSLERANTDWVTLFEKTDARLQFLGSRTPEGSLVSLIEAVYNSKPEN